MINSKLDYSYEESVKNNRKNNLLSVDTSEKKINFHYNVSSGVFSKIINFSSVQEKITLGVFAQGESTCNVKIKLNNVLIFDENFLNYIFVNEYVFADESNDLEVVITPSSGGIKNINISLFGKLAIKIDKKLMFFKENSALIFNGQLLSFNTFSSFLSNVCDIKPYINDKYYDISSNFSNENQKCKNYIILFENNNTLIYKEIETNKIVNVATGVSDACFVPVEGYNGAIVYLKNGIVNLTTVSSDYTLSDVIVLQQLSGLNITRLISIVTESPLSKFIAIGDENVYLVGFVGTSNTFSAVKIDLLFSGDNAQSFYYNNRLYLFSSSIDGVTLYTFLIGDTVKKQSEVFYANFDDGFVYGGDVYLRRGSLVRKLDT